MKQIRRLSIEDVVSFIQCPLLYTKFSAAKQPDNDLASAVKDSIVSFFRTEMRLGTFPDPRPLKTKWNKYIGEAGGDLTAKQVSDVVIELYSFYKRYLNDFYNKGFRVVGMNMPVYQGSGQTLLEETIPVVLSDGRYASPVFFGAKPELAARDNRIRFLSALLKDITDMEITTAVVIKTGGSKTVPSISLEKRPFSKFELDRADLQVKQTLELIDLGYETPNTSLCPQCYFSQYCRL